MSKFIQATVHEIIRLTPEAVSLRLQIPETDKERFHFVPGQYLTLRSNVNGEDLRRPYSICCAQSAEFLQVGVKKVDGGRFSTFVNDELRAGDTLDIMPPLGKFHWFAPKSQGVHHVAFASGSGITPVLSMISSIIEERPQDTVTLFYGNRRLSSIMFLEELHALKDRAMGRFQLFHILSREEHDSEILHGRLDAAKVRALAEHSFDPKSVDVVYICGPGGMIDEVSRTLNELGVPDDRLRFERFTPAQPSAKAPAASTHEDKAERSQVVAILDGTRRSFGANADENLVEAADRHGLELPYSCAGGMCCTCRCKLVEGQVEMATNYSLEPWELEAGFVLACQSHPTTDKVVVDFDAQ